MNTRLFKSLKTLAITFCLILVAANSPSLFADSDYSDMVVFGDSLSDPGNVFVLTGQVSVRPYAEGNIPSAPYPIGKGKTFSNGPTWSQLVAKTLQLNAGTGPALRNQTFTNYAFGGARASSTAGGPFDMSAQVAQYLADNGAADPDALYAVWFGGNDVRDALFAFFAGGADAAQAVITAAISNYATNMGILISAGATDFVVPSAPNVGVVPSVTAFGPEVSGLATLLSFAFNQGLSAVLDSLEGVPGISITRVDMFALTTDAVDNPGAYGFFNVEDACLTPVVYAGAICESPEGYLFWDGIHPTRMGHEMLADAVLSALP
jgi:phospholipase/lecithinase/hemolysin